jgi:aromatic ring-opening dioxygenase catalytic subunit (LigB family)
LQADVPVVCVSLHKSLSAEINMKIGTALAPLRDQDILILGSGYSFHNMNAFFNPSEKTVKASSDFNEWLKDNIMNGGDEMGAKLQDWASAPGGRISHPREEHLLPLLMVAAAGMESSGNCTPQVIYETEASYLKDGETIHKVTGYLFQ